MPAKAKPITIRGVTYRSIREAASAIGVRPVTIYNADANGTLETCGLGAMPMPVTIRVVRYESVAEAAAAIKVTTSTIYRAIDSGTLDRCGLGMGNRVRRSPKAGHKPKPLTVGGRRFPSISALAKFIGRDVSCVRRALSNNANTRARVLRQAMAAIVKEELALAAARVPEKPRNEKSAPRAA